MRLAERLALLSAGYKKKEIEQIEADELKELEAPTTPGEETTEPVPDYKKMYEELQEKNKVMESTLKEKETELSDLQAQNRNNSVADIKTPDYIGNILK